jgi:poly-gamma-glutamate biosynthesis protein PgsC/CapC
MVVETLAVGLIIALLFAERTGISPGGIIVPGYLALYLDQPYRVLATFCVAGVCLASYVFISRYFILFGRRRFVFMLLTGAFLAQAWHLAAPRLFSTAPELQVIGWVVPGILASSLEKQKFFPTVASLAAATVVTFFIIKAISMI